MTVPPRLAADCARRWLPLVLAACLLLAGVLAAPLRAHADDDDKETTAADSSAEKSEEDNEKSLKELQQKRDDAQKKIDQIKEEITASKEAGQAAQQLKSQYQAQQAQIKAQIETIREQIAVMEEMLNRKTLEIEAKQAEFDARWAGFKERMAAMQMLNDGGSISMLSQVTNLYELLTFSQTLEDIADRDQEICEELEAERDVLNAEKAEMEELKAQLDAQEEALAGKVDELAASIQAQNEKISAEEARQQALEESEDEAEKEFQAAVEALQSYLAAQNSKYNTPEMKTSLDFGIPIARYTRVSNVFGTLGTNNWRKKPHGGTDLAAPQGTEIYAAADGIVTAAGWNNGGYGYYVMILHGTADDGKVYSTLYGHMMQAPNVREGQAVTRGTCIGYVGSTGHSTGPHLHLEIRINNVRNDAQKYIPLP